MIDFKSVSFQFRYCIAEESKTNDIMTFDDFHRFLSHSQKLEISEETARELINFGNETHLSYDGKYQTTNWQYVASKFQKNVFLKLRVQKFNK